MQPRGAVLALAGLALAAILSGPPAALAQQELEHWTTYANGDEVLALALDPESDAELWAGTEGGGLVVWDLGTGRFRQHLFPMQPGLESNDVTDIALDSANGEAWLATGIGVSQVRDGDWTAYGAADGLPDGPLTAVAIDRNGVVWAGSHRGLAKLEPRSGSWDPMPAVEFDANRDEPEDGPGSNRVFDIAVDRDGLVWVVHGTGSAAEQPAASVYDPTARTWRHIASEGPTGDPTTGPRTDKILVVAVDEADGKVWLGSNGRGVLTYDPATDEWTETPAGSCGTTISDLTVRDGKAWVACRTSSGTSGTGAAYWDGTAWEAHSTLEGLPTNVIVAVAMAADGQAYLGTNGTALTASELGGHGVVPVDDRAYAPALSTFPQTPASNDITVVQPQPGGPLWVGTRGAGLMRYDGSTWSRHTRDSTDEGLLGDTVTDLALRRDRELWVSTAATIREGGVYVDGGVSVLDIATGRWTLQLQATSAGLPDENVASLALGPDGRVWIGTGAANSGASGPPIYQGRGLAAYDPAGDAWQTFAYDPAGGELAGDTVLDLAIRGGETWAATAYAPDAAQRRVGGGVSRLLGGGWTSWSADENGFRTVHGSGQAGDRDGLIEGDVRSIQVDHNDRAIAGTYDLDDFGQISQVWPYVDAVLNRSDGSDWESFAVPGAGWASAIAEDEHAQIWFGTTRGHDRQEFPIDRSDSSQDSADGGAFLWTGPSWTDETDWIRLAPPESGIASKAITALAWDESGKTMWVGTENGGLSAYRGSQAQPTATSCPSCTAPPAPPTATPRPPAGATATGPAVVPSTPHGPPPPIAEPGSDSPPSEVPEASTLLLLGAGLAGLAAYARRRRNGNTAAKE